MSALSAFWFVVGIIWGFAGKSFLEVAACFLLCGIFEGSYELYRIRKEFEEIDEREKEDN